MVCLKLFVDIFPYQQIKRHTPLGKHSSFLIKMADIICSKQFCHMKMNSHVSKHYYKWHRKKCWRVRKKTNMDWIKFLNIFSLSYLLAFPSIIIYSRISFVNQWNKDILRKYILDIFSTYSVYSYIRVKNGYV